MPVLIKGGEAWRNAQNAGAALVGAALPQCRSFGRPADQKPGGGRLGPWRGAKYDEAMSGPFLPRIAPPGLRGDGASAVRQTLETAAVGGAGAALFLALHVPAGAILGALSFTALASLSGRRLGWPDPVRTALFLITGFSAGSAVTPATLQAAALWPLSIVALAVTTGVMWASGWLVFRRLSGADAKTAFYASAPGALSTIMILAEREDADIPRVAVAQSLRLLVLVGSAPFALSAGHVAPLPAEAPALVEGIAAWALAIAAALAGWKLAERRRWPASVFLGAFLGSAALHVAGVVGVRLSPPVLMTATAALGALIGSRFSGVRVRDLVRFLPASLGLVLAMAAVGLPVGLLVGTLTGVGPAAGLLAFAPGSMEMMVAISLSLNAHPAYVVAHHLFRTVLLLALVPALSARWSAAVVPEPPAG